MLLDVLYTLAAFAGTAALAPAVLLSYACVSACRAVWLYVLQSVHPDVEFVRDLTIRTLADTRWNQGVFTVLVRVTGEPRLELVRRHVAAVLRRRPKLRMCLVSRWGSYAWRARDFHLERHVMLAPPIYRGRAVAEHNIQDCVSDAVAKHLSRGAPPWQLVVFPTAAGAHYLLLRLHHLLLTDGNVNIADLLPMEAPADVDAACREDEFDARLERTSALLHVFEAPRAIPCLYETAQENLTNRWNEFISRHDPLQRPELLKQVPALPQFCATALVAAAGTARELLRPAASVRSDLKSDVGKQAGEWAGRALATAERECSRRQLSAARLARAARRSLGPRSLLLAALRLWWRCVSLVWRVPLAALREARSLCSGLVAGRGAASPDTAACLLLDYAPAVVRALHELARCTWAAVAAPRALLHELFAGGRPAPGVATCGRKVVAWSTSVKLERVTEVADRAGVSETAVMLTAVAAAVQRYCAAAEVTAPDRVPVVARHINKNYVFASGPDVRPQNAVGGALCLRLPLPVALGGDARSHLDAVAGELEAARARQPAVYLAALLQTKHCLFTKLLPAVAVAVAAKYLSKRYALAVTELMANEHHMRRVTSWGEQVTNVLYWRPPQANMSASLCLNHYGDEVTLAVMADALLTPHHMALAAGLAEHVDELRRALALDARRPAG